MVLAPETMNVFETPREVRDNETKDARVARQGRTKNRRPVQRQSSHLTEAETQGSNVHALMETSGRRNGLDRWLKALKPDDVNASLRTRNPKGRKTSGNLQGCEDLRISEDIEQRQEGRLSPGGKEGETATGEGKASKGARVSGKGPVQRTRKGTEDEARNMADPRIGSGV